MGDSACLTMNNIGKPYSGKPNVRFDEGGQAEWPALYSTLSPLFPLGDTRYSGSEVIVRKLTEMGGEVFVHDPYVRHWWEFEKQDTYPETFAQLVKFFIL